METFFLPLAPLFNMAIITILFYIKHRAISSNCPPRQSWSGNEAQTFIFSLLFLMFLLQLFTVNYVLFNFRPSPCGPFQEYATTGEVFHNIFFEKDKTHTASNVVRYFTSPGVMFAIFCALCFVVFFVRAKSLGHIALVKNIREQIIMESKDKVFLLELYDDALKMHAQKNGNSEKNDVILQKMPYKWSKKRFKSEQNLALDESATKEA